MIYKQFVHGFTTINNVVFTCGLSLKGIGLYTYIANKPDGWDFSIKGTAAQLKDGIDSVQSAVHELETVGLLKRILPRDTERSQGKFRGGDWILLDVFENTDGVSPSPEKPLMENPSQVNTKEIDNEKENFSKTKIDIGLCTDGELEDLTKNPISPYYKPALQELRARKRDKNGFRKKSYTLGRTPNYHKFSKPESISNLELVSPLSMQEYIDSRGWEVDFSKTPYKDFEGMHSEYLKKLSASTYKPADYVADVQLWIDHQYGWKIVDKGKIKSDGSDLVKKYWDLTEQLYDLATKLSSKDCEDVDANIKKQGEIDAEINKLYPLVKKYL